MSNNQKRLKLALRLGALCITFIFTAIFMVGCSGGGKVKLSPDKPVTVTVWHYYSSAQKSSFDTMVAEFNDTIGLQEGIIVEAYNQGNIGELTASIMDSANSKVGSKPVPNIFAAYADTAYVIDKLGLVVPLEEHMSKEDMEKYVPAYLDEGKMGEGNKAKIFPIAKSTEILMLNETDWKPFADATGAKHEDLATFEGIADTAKKYYEWSEGKALFGRDSMSNYMIIGSKQLGANIFEVKDSNVTLNIDTAALKRIWDCYYTPFVSGYFAANGKFRSDDARVGDIIAVTGSTTSATFFPSEVSVPNETPYPIEAICLPSPSFEGGEAFAVQQGAGMVVTRSTPEQEYAAFEFLQWFTEPKRNLEFGLSSCYLPVTIEANKPEVWKKVLEESGIDNKVALQTLGVAFEMAQKNTLYTNPPFENGTSTRNVLEKSLFERSVADRAEVLANMEKGDSLEVAVGKVNTPENFEAWVSSLKEELTKTQTGK